MDAKEQLMAIILENPDLAEKILALILEAIKTLPVEE